MLAVCYMLMQNKKLEVAFFCRAQGICCRKEHEKLSPTKPR